MTSLIFILFLASVAQRAAALQVTPDSPCASFCIDSSGLDVSDPNSSNTKNEDITCNDSEYSTRAAGQKFQSCVSCLQDSTFAQGKQNDQLWFLYNIRYTFDYCVFGFPNATDVASTPCSTSTACGELEDALKEGILDPGNPDYSYCAVDGGVMTSEVVSKCLSCVAASDGQDYLANYLVALETGCKQQPPAGTLVGLNDTVFSKTMISAIDPAMETTAKGNQTALSVPQIAGVAVGAIVIFLAIAGFIFVRCRKRRNRRLRLESANSTTRPKRSHHRPASSLSFRCQAHLSPRSPAFFPNPSDTTVEEEKPFSQPYPALGSHPIFLDSPMSRQPMWRAQNPIPGSKEDIKSLHLHNIAIAIPTIPGNVHHSTSPKAARFSPIDDLTTPASTTSTKSTAQLLPFRPYNPAEYGVAPPQAGGNPIHPDGSTFTSPTSGSTASPLLSRAWDQRTPTWDLPARVSSRSPGAGPALEFRVGAGMAVGRNRERGKRTSNIGSPVETEQINISFPAPPTRR
ncbi:hypothetical protein F4779DRAFT_135315 [Xylariaceae sp. FL0662B]|nr:hypothetical protein F4779DRAFT_135315 [Xylariaceae sp. FL0662B]